MVDDASNRVFHDLVDWITQRSDCRHGVVHESLELRGCGSLRGVYTRNRIDQGETLISLPLHMTVNGSHYPVSYGERVASNWLRCIAAFFSARRHHHQYRPYLNSLPTEYESLLNWTDDEVANYLGGTNLCSLILYDRHHKTLEERYQQAVRPYLEHLGLVLSSDSLLDGIQEFREACMCVATRGFHSDDFRSDSIYSGPFLLPLIDLLNHDTSRKCTSLQFKDRSFFMEAERDIDKDEEICHSYGDDLTSAQVLQTFGFVPELFTDKAERNVRIGNHITPAILLKSDLVSAIQAVIESSFPSELRAYMKSTPGLLNEESWDLEHDISSRDLTFCGDTLVVSNKLPLSEELVTLCCVLFLPHDVYSELSASGLTLLESSVLDDYYLGKLVCQAINNAVLKKVSSYTPVRIPGGISQGQHDLENDSAILRSIRRNPELSRAVFGLTVRLDEKASLFALQSEIKYVSDSLGGLGLANYDKSSYQNQN